VLKSLTDRQLWLARIKPPCGDIRCGELVLRKCPIILRQLGWGPTTPWAITFSKVITAPAWTRFMETSGRRAENGRADSRHFIRYQETDTTEHAAHSQTGEADVIGTRQGSFHHPESCTCSIGGKISGTQLAKGLRGRIVIDGEVWIVPYHAHAHGTARPGEALAKVRVRGYTSQRPRSGVPLLRIACFRGKLAVVPTQTRAVPP
jgi:hypothetical protein